MGPEVGQVRLLLRARPIFGRAVEASVLYRF
jgi:hypothetical protein